MWPTNRNKMHLFSNWYKYSEPIVSIHTEISASYPVRKLEMRTQSKKPSEKEAILAQEKLLKSGFEQPKLGKKKLEGPSIYVRLTSFCEKPITSTKDGKIYNVTECKGHVVDVKKVIDEIQLEFENKRNSELAKKVPNKTILEKTTPDFIEIDEATKEKKLFAPSYFTEENKDPITEKIGMPLKEGMLLGNFSVRVVSGNLEIGAYAVVRDFYYEAKANGKGSFPCGSALQILHADTYAGPYSCEIAMDNVTTHIPKQIPGTTTYHPRAKAFKSLIDAALDYANTYQIHKEATTKYNAYVFFVPAANARYGRVPKNGSVEMVSDMFHLMKYGAKGTVIWGLPSVVYESFIKNALPKQETPTVVPGKHEAQTFIGGRFKIDEDGKDPIDDTALTCRTYIQGTEWECKPSTKRPGKFLESPTDVWPITNREAFNATANQHAVDIVAYCESSEDPQKIPNYPENDEMISESTFKGKLRCVGGWYTKVQNVGLLVSKEFSRTILRYMINDMNIYKNTALLSKKEITARAKLISCFTGTFELTLINNDGNETQPINLSHKNPLNNGTGIVKLLNEYTLDDADTLLAKPEVEVQWLPVKEPSEDGADDAADVLLQQYQSPLLTLEDGTNPPDEHVYSFTRIMMENHDFLQKRDDNLLKKITNQNEMMLLIMFAEYISIAPPGFEVDFAPRKNAYYKVIVPMVDKIIKETIAVEGGPILKYIPGNHPWLQKWFFQAWSMPSLSTKKRGNQDDESTGKKVKIDIPPMI